MVHNISLDDIPSYLCIADTKSQLKIKIPHPNDQDYGLFFINSQFCGQNETGGICSMKCSELWDDNISDDIECVQTIDEKNYFAKWNLSANECSVYARKLLECIDKNKIQSTEIPKKVKILNDENKSASDLKYDVITDSDAISDMTDKKFLDLYDNERNEKVEFTTTMEPQKIDQTLTNSMETLTSTTENVESNKNDDESKRSTTEKSQESKIPDILARTISLGDVESTNTANQIKNVPISEILFDDHIPKQIESIISNITNSDNLPKNGSIIVNIFNFNIFRDKHDIKYSVNNPATKSKDEN